MFYPYKKGNGEWTNTVPLNQEQTPYTPLWSSGDGYQTNNLFIVRASDTIVTTPATAYTSEQVNYNMAIVDDTDWFNTETCVWTPTVAGWWQIIAGAINSAPSSAENIVSMSGAVYAQQDTVGLNCANLSGFGYFNGTTSSVQVNIATGQAGPINHQQNPQTSIFQAIYLRP